MSRRTRDQRLLAAVHEKPWAILESSYLQILDIVHNHARGVRLTDEEITEALEAARPRDRGGAPPGGIAVLPLWGPIVPHADMLTQMSGATALDAWLADFRELVADPSVGTIVLNVDSPGGSVDLVTETAQAIRDSRKSKHIVAVANTLAASAAYDLAAQADELYVSPSGMVGSIGVFLAHEDISQMLEQEGVKVTLISAGKYKTEGNSFEPLSDEARAAKQKLVDSYYQLFVADVAKGRGVDTSTVEASYGQGRVLTARAAVQAGMVDGVQSLDQTLAKLAGSSSSRARPRQLAAVGTGSQIAATAGDITVGRRFGRGFVQQIEDIEGSTTMTLVFDHGAQAGPIPYSKTDVVDEPWDGPGQVTKLNSPVTKTRGFGMFAWYDANGNDPDGDGYPDAKDDWKFEHHRVGADGEPNAAVVSACRNGLARLDQANIPEGDRDGVRAHLQHHIDDFNQANQATDARQAASHTRTGKENTMDTVPTDGRPPTREELVARQDQIRDEQAALNAGAPGREYTAEEAAQDEALEKEYWELDSTIKNLDDRDARERAKVEAAAKKQPAFKGDGGNSTPTLEKFRTNAGRKGPENIFDLAAYRSHAGTVDGLGPLWADGAKRANELADYRTDHKDETRAFVEALIRLSEEKSKPHESFAHRLLMTADPAYEEAFGRWVMGRETVRDTDRIKAAVTNTGLGSETPVPVTIDPTVLFTGDGSRDPLRTLARVVTITGLKWRGIATDGITMSYGAEASAFSPGTPSFDAPDITVVKAKGEIQFSIEVDTDWPSLREELQREFAQAKLDLEADKFMNGTGSNEPTGLMYALVTDATSLVKTAAHDTIALDDVDNVADSLPANFDGNAAWLAHKRFYSKVSQLARTAGVPDPWTNLAAGVAPDNPLVRGALKGYPAYSHSEISSAFDADQTVAIIGDFERGFVIVDRVGLNVELDPHPRDGNGAWLGQRALLAWFRNNTGLRTANAFRVLEVKGS